MPSLYRKIFRKIFYPYPPSRDRLYKRALDLSRYPARGLVRRSFQKLRKDNFLVLLFRLPSYLFILFLTIVFKAQFIRGLLPARANPYEIWLQKNRLGASSLKRMRRISRRWKYRPLISIITPVFNTPKAYLITMIESVRAQSYENWELCPSDDASTKPWVKEVLREYAEKDPRIKVSFRKKNGHICRASNSALDLAKGEFIALLDHDDELSPDALYEVVSHLQQNPNTDLIYSDEDKLDPNGRRIDPYFKPDWSPDMFLSNMYVGHLGVYRRALVEEVGRFRPGYEGSQDYDLALRVAEKTDRIFHIPKVLYHWRQALGSAAGAEEAKLYASGAGKKALEDALKRRKIKGKVLLVPLEHSFVSYRVKRSIMGHPKVTIIIPTKDKLRLLKQCVESIEQKTVYPNYEIVIVDNRSQERETKLYFRSTPHKVLKFNEPFNFSRMNNFAVQKTKGEILLFLNNDTEVINEGWLEAMLEHAQRMEVGAVGAKLIYPNDTIQHAGVILGLGGLAGHSHKYFPADSHGYFGSLDLIRNYSAVTGACLMMRRNVFNEVEMFEEKLSHAFNDVDLCIKIRSKGYLIVYTPFSQLYHHESASRPLLVKDFELRYMRKKWGKFLKNDPYYNPNLTQNREDFSLRVMD